MKNRWWVLMTAIFFVIVNRPAVCVEEVKNLLKNPSFHAATNPGFPDYWVGQSGWREGAHELTDESSVPGTMSMKLSNADGKQTSYQSANVGWSPGKEGTIYTFSVYLKAEPPGLAATIGGDRLERKKVEVGGEWTRCTVTAPLKAASGYAGRFLSVGVALLTEKKGVLYVNAPMLVRGESDGTYQVEDPRVKEVSVQQSVPASQAINGEWVFDETADKDAEGRLMVKDLSGHGADGGIFGNPSWVKTTCGPALKFDGNTYVLIPYRSSLDTDKEEFSLEILLQPLSGKTMPVLCKGMHFGGYALQVSSGKIHPIVSAWNLGPVTQVFPRMEHIVVTFRRPRASIYVAGSLVGEKDIDVAMNPQAQKRPLIIGGFDVWNKEKGYHAEPGFEGYVRLVRLYRRALTDEEVAGRYRDVVN